MRLFIGRPVPVCIYLCV